MATSPELELVGGADATVPDVAKLEAGRVEFAPGYRGGERPLFPALEGVTTGTMAAEILELRKFVRGLLYLLGLDVKEYTGQDVEFLGRVKEAEASWPTTS